MTSGTVPPRRASRRAEVESALERTWRDPPGLWGWLTTVDHKRIAIRMIVTAFIAFLLGGLEAAAMRTQLARPENALLGPDLYNQVFTVHGTTMMFLFAVPVMEGFGLYFVPLMVGARNVAFPRLNALGYWVYLTGIVLLYGAFLANTGPDAGWSSYVPLAGPEYTPGKRADVWAQVITFSEISALIAAVNIIATVLKHRAPGMTLNRLPLFVWAELVAGFMIVFAMPVVATASLMLAGDRLLGMHHFNPAEGGDSLLWQHLFWFFGHPEVYIIFLPATGMVSAVLPAFARRPVFGYPAMVLALIATGFLAFGLWVHHMFATPLPQLGESYFTAASMLIAIPSGVQVFCWIATLWSGRLHLRTPLLFVLGFLFLFVLGGLTGVMLASVPFDLQAHDTYFVVAHFHYVLVGGSVFPLFAAAYYWFPKFTGRLLGEGLGRLHFWLFFLGMNLTFFPMHWLGLAGMPRRVYTYQAGLGWDGANLLASAGAATIALSVLVFLANVARALRRPRHVPADPWGGETLEWAADSPPPAYNFAQLPVVEGRSSLWSRAPDGPVVTGLRDDRREGLVTSVLDATPVKRQLEPEPTIAPLLAALAIAVTFIVTIWAPWGVPLGGTLLLLAMTVWAWPRGVSPVEEAEERARHDRMLAREGR